MLFSDIRGFTSISERLDPEQLVRLLNEHLTPMTRAVMANGGLVDKFIGDAVMAFFGAPVSHDDHASRALATVLQMHAALAAPAPTFADLGAEIAIGVGVNTGDMIVGNMGSTERFNYTVIGDSVSLSSRLEGLTKTYGVFCLVGEETRHAVGDAFPFRELHIVQVKGKAEPVRIFELMAGPDRTIAAYTSMSHFAEGLGAFRAGNFVVARAAFSGFAEANPTDRAVQLYLERLGTLGDIAPPGWRPAHVFTSK